MSFKVVAPILGMTKWMDLMNFDFDGIMDHRSKLSINPLKIH